MLWSVACKELLPAVLLMHYGMRKSEAYKLSKAVAAHKLLRKLCLRNCINNIHIITLIQRSHTKHSNREVTKINTHQHTAEQITFPMLPLHVSLPSDCSVPIDCSIRKFQPM